MSKRPEKSWSLWCDWPSHEFQFESEDYSIFGDGYDAEEIVTDSDGHVGVDGKHYCHDHPCTWESDYEAGEKYPAPPFLLIHDGNEAFEDGRVSLVEHLHDGEPCLTAVMCPFREIQTEALHYDSLVIAEGIGGTR